MTYAAQRKGSILCIADVSSSSYSDNLLGAAARGSVKTSEIPL